MDCKALGLNPDVTLVVTTIHCGEAPAVKTVTTVKEFMDLFGEDMVQIAEENFFEVSDGWYKGRVWCYTKYREMDIVRCNTLDSISRELIRQVRVGDFDYIDGYNWEDEPSGPIPMVYDTF